MWPYFPGQQQGYVTYTTGNTTDVSNQILYQQLQQYLPQYLPVVRPLPAPPEPVPVPGEIAWLRQRVAEVSWHGDQP